MITLVTLENRKKKMRRMGRVGGGNTPSDWFKNLPPITKALMVSTLLTTIACVFGITNEMSIALLKDPIWHRFEIWRFVTNFLYLVSYLNCLIINCVRMLFF